MKRFYNSRILLDQRTKSYSKVFPSQNLLYLQKKKLTYFKTNNNLDLWKRKYCFFEQKYKTFRYFSSITPTNPNSGITELKSNETSIEKKEQPEILVGAGLESVLNHKAIVVSRQMEWGSLILGYEQAQKYTLMNENGLICGYLAEDESKVSSMFTRQLMRNHRPFKATILDTSGNIVLEINRPAFLISTSLYVHIPNSDQPLGEVHMKWHLMRRKYDLFIGQNQFGAIDEQMLQWDFHLKDDQGKLLGTINKNWTGFGRELFTEAGQYIIRMDPSILAETGCEVSRPMNLNERAMILATAISIDYDYFSRKQGGWFPFMYFGGNPTPNPVPNSTDENVPHETTAPSNIPENENISQDEKTWDMTKNTTDEKEEEPWSFEEKEEGGWGSKLSSFFGDDDD